MKIEMKEGQPVIDATYLAELLRLTPAEVQAKMRSGQITSRFEIGQDEDAGRMRLTFLYDDQRVRLTCLEDGTILKTLRTKTGGS